MVSMNKPAKPGPSPGNHANLTKAKNVPIPYAIPDPPDIPFLNSHSLAAMFLVDEPGGMVKKNITQILSPKLYQQMLETVEQIQLSRDLAAAGYRIRIAFERFPII